MIDKDKEYVGRSSGRKIKFLYVSEQHVIYTYPENHKPDIEYYDSPRTFLKYFKPAPKKVTMWMNIYKFDYSPGYYASSLFTDKESALRSKSEEDYVVTVPISFEVEDD